MGHIKRGKMDALSWTQPALWFSCVICICVNSWVELLCWFFFGDMSSRTSSGWIGGELCQIPSSGAPLPPPVYRILTMHFNRLQSTHLYTLLRCNLSPSALMRRAWSPQTQTYSTVPWTYSFARLLKRRLRDSTLCVSTALSHLRHFSCHPWKPRLQQLRTRAHIACSVTKRSRTFCRLYMSSFLFFISFFFSWLHHTAACVSFSSLHSDFSSISLVGFKLENLD